MPNGYAGDQYFRAGRGVSRGAVGPLLEGVEWKDRLSDALSQTGGIAQADRCYVFENLRGPDGRLWMDLIGEWTAPGVGSLLAEPGAKLHPYHPDFLTWIDVFDGGGELVGPIEEMAEPARSALLAEGTVSAWLVPIMSGDGWWGFVGIDALAPRAWTDTDGDAVRALARQIGDAVQRAQVRTEQVRAKDRFRSLVEDSPLVSYIDAPDETATAVYVSPQIEDLIGYTVEEWMGDQDLWPRILHPDDRARALAENARHNETGEPFQLEYRLLHRDGHVVWVHDQARVVRDERGKIVASQGVLLDITTRKRADEQLAFRTYHDELTGLPSREMFEELVELSVARARRHEGAVAVLCVDLVDFRLVNDSLGHRAGDGLLVAVADRLREATRETDLVARRGGDQFLLLLADLDRDETGPDGAVLRAESVAQRVHESLSEAFSVDGTEVYITAGVGISLFPRDAEDAAALQRNAETAMFEAKRTGGTNYCLVRRRRCGLGRAPAFRDAPAQGGGRPAMDALLPAGGRPGGRSHGRCRGAHPLDRARRHDHPAQRLHPPGRGTRPDRTDRRLGRAGAHLSGVRLAGARHRPRGWLQPVSPPVLAAGPCRSDPAGVPHRRRGPVEGAGGGDGDLGDDGPRPRDGHPAGADRRRASRSRSTTSGPDIRRCRACVTCRCGS